MKSKEEGRDLATGESGMSDTEQYFVHTGLSRGEYFGTYIRKSNGSLKRVVSKDLPLRQTYKEAEDDLMNWLGQKVYLNGVKGRAPFVVSYNALLAKRQAERAEHVD